MSCRMCLLNYRWHEKQISVEHREKQFLCDREVKQRQLNALLGTVTEEELDLHVSYTSNNPFTVIDPTIVRWFARLLKKIKKYIFTIRKCVETADT